MPRFYLHVRTPHGLIEDEEGSEYADYARAVLEAVRGARCLMTGEVAGGTLCLNQSIEIHDSDGAHLTSVPFSEAVRLVDAPEQARDTGIAESSA